MSKEALMENEPSGRGGKLIGTIVLPFVLIGTLTVKRVSGYHI